MTELRVLSYQQAETAIDALMVSVLHAHDALEDQLGTVLGGLEAAPVSTHEVRRAANAALGTLHQLLFSLDGLRRSLAYGG